MKVTPSRQVIPPRWEQLRYHPKQYAAWTSKARFINIAAGRGSGKTELARRKTIASLAVKKPWPKPLYFYALPTFAQAKRVAWNELLDLIPDEWIENISIQELTITTVFGSKLIVLGTDQPHRLEGVQYDGGVLDEASDQKPGVFNLSVMPALTHRKGWCWRIGVPKRSGIGSLEFRLACEYGESGVAGDTESYSWPSAEILSVEELETFKKRMDAKDFAEQFEASWESAGGLVAYSFQPSIHVRDELCVYRPHLPLHIGMDFNVDPMSWTIGQIVEDHPLAPGEKLLFVLDEISIRNTNTVESLEELNRRWGHHKGQWVFSGDAASRQRNTSASQSDYLHIVNSKAFVDKKLIIPKRNPPLADRFSILNTVLMNADKEIHMYVHSKCKILIRDLSYLAYKEGTTEVNHGNSELGHMFDSCNYLVYSQFPMRVDHIEQSSIAIHGFR